jgi:hypothetical protein
VLGTESLDTFRGPALCAFVEFFVEKGLDEFDETSFRGISLDSAVEIELLSFEFLELLLSFGNAFLLFRGGVGVPSIGGGETLD